MSDGRGLSYWLAAIPKGFALFVGLAVLTMHGLFFWQLHRLHWKNQLVAEMAQAAALPPESYEELTRSGHVEWRLARLQPCRADANLLIYIHSDYEGLSGFRVLVPCPGIAGKQVVVDLGFVAAKPLSVPDLDFTPVGRVRGLPKDQGYQPSNNIENEDWYWRSASDLSRTWRMTVESDHFIVLDLSASKLNIPGLTQGVLTAPLSNRHLEYALTWLALAWTLVAIFVGYVWQRRRQMTHQG